MHELLKRFAGRFALTVSLVMYVFQFVESMLMLPFFYQEWLRLREISGRLAAAEGEG